MASGSTIVIYHAFGDEASVTCIYHGVLTKLSFFSLIPNKKKKNRYRITRLMHRNHRTTDIPRSSCGRICPATSKN